MLNIFTRVYGGAIASPAVDFLPGVSTQMSNTAGEAEQPRAYLMQGATSPQLERDIVFPPTNMKISPWDPVGQEFVPLSLARAALTVGLTDEPHTVPQIAVCHDADSADFKQIVCQTRMHDGEAGKCGRLSSVRVTLSLAGQAPSQQTKNNRSSQKTDTMFAYDVPYVDAIKALRSGRSELHYLAHCSDGVMPNGQEQRALLTVGLAQGGAGRAARESAAAFSEQELLRLESQTVKAQDLQQIVFEEKNRRLEAIAQAAGALAGSPSGVMQVVSADQNGRQHMSEVAVPSPVAQMFGGCAFFVPTDTTGGPNKQQAVAGAADAARICQEQEKILRSKIPNPLDAQKNTWDWNQASEVANAYVMHGLDVFASALLEALTPAVAARMQALHRNASDAHAVSAYLRGVGGDQLECGKLYRATLDASRKQISVAGSYCFDERISGLERHAVTSRTGQVKFRTSFTTNAQGEHQLLAGQMSRVDLQFRHLQKKGPDVSFPSTVKSTGASMSSNSRFDGFQTQDAGMYGDCEDFATGIIAVVRFMKAPEELLMPVIDEKLSTAHPEVQMIKTELSDAVRSLSRHVQVQEGLAREPVAREFSSTCLGLAKAANPNQQAAFANQELAPQMAGEHFKALMQGPKAGHCFGATAQMYYMGRVGDDVHVSEVLPGSLEFLEGTANSQRFEGPDRMVRCRIASDNPKMDQALGAIKDRIMPLSVSMNIRSELRAKSLQSFDFNCKSVAQIDPDDRSNCFYQSLIAFGPHTMACVDRTGDSALQATEKTQGMPRGAAIFPTTPVAAGRVRMLALSTDLSPRERAAIDILVKANCHMYPDTRVCNALPVSAFVASGPATPDTVTIRHDSSRVDAFDPGKTACHRAEVAAHVHATSWQAVDNDNTQYWF